MVTWDPWTILSPAPSTHTVFLLLNQRVEDQRLVVDLWNRAQYRVTVDGGTSVWHSIINNVDKEVFQPVPDLITGDLDSANMENVEYFRKLGARVVPTPDQDHTDFTKALMELGSLHKAGDGRVAGAEAVVAFVETGGRVDHVMGNLQSLALVPALAPALCPTYLCSSHSLSWLLAPGSHRMSVPASRPQHCGLIPIDGEATVTTTGLRWNLNSQPLRFGNLISTSNSFDPKSSEVTVKTNKTLLWTMDLPEQQH